MLRNRAATGQLASGGTNVDLQKNAEGLANQTYQQYVQNLMPYIGANTTAATGLAATQTGLGTAVNGNQGLLAQLGYNASTGVGNAYANSTIAQQQADTAAGNNTLSALGGGLSAILGFL